MTKIPYKGVLLAGWLALASLSAAVIDYDPERLVSLQLANGGTVTGRIIDVQTDRLQLVCAGFNRMIAFQDLSAASRKSLGLPEVPPAGVTAPVTSVVSREQTGINATRDRLRESLERFDASRYSGWSRESYDPWVYSSWPVYYQPWPFYPWNPRCHPPGHGGGWNIQIGF